MKKAIFAAAAAVIAMAGVAKADDCNTIASSQPFDNYSITLKGGVASPIDPTEGNIIDNLRGTAGLEIRKQIVPAFGFGVEGEAGFNTSSWNKATHLKNIVDHSYIGAFGAVNLNNLFAGYAGQPRPFEVEVVGGLGWIRGYAPSSQGNDWDDVGFKLGLNLNFNLGAEKAWTIGIKPSVLTDVSSHGFFSKSQTIVALQAGVTYHFGNSNGTHSFTFVTPCDHSELNAQINALRAENAALTSANTNLTAQANALAAQLDDCLKRPAKVETVVENTNSLESVRYVFYKIGSSTISADQVPNVEMIASYLKHNTDAKVDIKGYASPDGNIDVNNKLAAARAESVKTMLIKKYGISADRISAEGQGIGNMFKEESWNRVAICILNDAK
jgi:outer membrane protein OmpA-like peptidoglycan-associated protein